MTSTWVVPAVRPGRWPVTLIPARPPGDGLVPRWLDRPVISCDEAAAARGVPLRNELKSLILETTGGLVVAHVRGDSLVSLRAVKSTLVTSQARMAADETLRGLGLGPGTVCAVLDPTWSLPHLLDRAVLDLDYVTTNNGTSTGWFRFDPRLLLSAPSCTVGELARTVDTG